MKIILDLGAVALFTFILHAMFRMLSVEAKFVVALAFIIFLFLYQKLDKLEVALSEERREEKEYLAKRKWYLVPIAVVIIVLISAFAPDLLIRTYRAGDEAAQENKTLKEQRKMYLSLINNQSADIKKLQNQFMEEGAQWKRDNGALKKQLNDLEKLLNDLMKSQIETRKK